MASEQFTRCVRPCPCYIPCLPRQRVDFGHGDCTLSQLKWNKQGVNLFLLFFSLILTNLIQLQGAWTVIFPDLNEMLLLSASDSEELDMDDDEWATTELPHKVEQLVAFEEQLEVLSLDWPDEQATVIYSKLDESYLTSGCVLPPDRKLS